MLFDHNPALSSVSDQTLRDLLASAGKVRESYRVLDKAGLNIVGEVLRGQGTFYEMEHYPQGDVYDRESHSQYYYHAHREDVAEHGHFHTFIRADAMPQGTRPAQGFVRTEPWPEGDDAVAHLVAVSMDAWGFPVGLFTTNRWVTDETWYYADVIETMLAQFQIDHAWPSWPVNVWLSHLIRLYRFQIVALLRERDRVIAAQQLQLSPGQDVLEDRRLEVLSSLNIDVDAWESQLRVEWQKRKIQAEL